MADLSRLPGPNADLWEWQMRGSCREADADLFFHPEGERGPKRARRDLAAKAVCQQCPVLTACRSHALRVREPYGVWGGLTEDERLAIYEQEEPAVSAEPAVRAGRDAALEVTAGPANAGDEPAAGQCRPQQLRAAS